MSKRKAKPSDPQDIARLRREREMNREEVERLSEQSDVTLNLDERTGLLVGAWRRDAVSMMRDAGSITDEEAGYVRLLEALVQKANGRSPSCLSVLDRVHGGPVGDHLLVSKIEAARALAQRQSAMDPMTWGLLRELCDGNLLISRWRSVVQRRTGEVTPKAQGAVVRHAFRVLSAVENALHQQALVQKRAA